PLALHDALPISGCATSAPCSAWCSSATSWARSWACGWAGACSRRPVPTSWCGCWPSPWACSPPPCTGRSTTARCSAPPRRPPHEPPPRRRRAAGRREGGSILTLSNRGEVIGACALLREEDGMMQLARMAVAAGERGKGWGRILLATALQRARQLGARRVRLFSNTRLGAAIHLYEAVGFRAVHRGPHPRYA